MAAKPKAAGGAGAEQKAIFVAVRTRPLSLAERVNENAQAIFPTTNERVIKICGDGKDNDYTLDHCFWENDSNEHVYNTIGIQTLDNAFAGFNGTIFAYGQTVRTQLNKCTRMPLRWLVPQLTAGFLRAGLW
eukprot:SAG11_NODE_7778_length_1097_cov_1.185371_1_plen_132_part_00